MMKIFSKQILWSPILILLAGTILTVSGQTDARIEAINKISNEANEKIAECEANGEYSSTFLTELIVNKNNGSYPAVGIFKTVFKFYYTYGNREKDPYPNRLLKITVTTNRSNRKEYSEYLFNPAGQLIFFFAKNDEAAERRYYFSLEKLIRSQKDEKTVNIKSRQEIAAVNAILREKRKMESIFRDSRSY